MNILMLSDWLNGCKILSNEVLELIKKKKQMMLASQLKLDCYKIMMQMYSQIKPMVSQ
jgi:hypothetical protein